MRGTPRALALATHGEHVGVHREGAVELDVVVRTEAHPHEIGLAPVRASGSSVVRVSDVATLRHGSEPLELVRCRSERCVLVHVFGDLAGLDAARERALELEAAEPGVRVSWRGGLGSPAERAR